MWVRRLCSAVRASAEQVSTWPGGSAIEIDIDVDGERHGLRVLSSLLTAVAAGSNNVADNPGDTISHSEEIHRFSMHATGSVPADCSTSDYHYGWKKSQGYWGSNAEHPCTVTVY